MPTLTGQQARELLEAVGEKPGKRAKGRRDIRVAPADRRTYKFVTYASRAEARYAALLDLQVMGGRVMGWVYQARFVLGAPENTYRPDFLVWLPDGTTEAHEVKGFKKRDWQRTVKLWMRYGWISLVVIDFKTLQESERIVPEGFTARQRRAGRGTESTEKGTGTGALPQTAVAHA